MDDVDVEASSLDLIGRNDSFSDVGLICRKAAGRIDLQIR
jgi:hypothetical protein